MTEKALDPQYENEIVEILERDPIVTSVHDIKSTSFAPDYARFKAEILFNGEQVTQRYIEGKDFDRDIMELKKCQTDTQIKEWTIKHGAGVVSALGVEIDRLEVNIKKTRPEVKHIDLEIL